MTTDIDNSVGEFELLARDGVSHLRFTAYMQNHLWYHYLTPDTYTTSTSYPIIHQLNDTALHELWHHCLGHPGQTITDIIHHYVDGVPKLRPNKFYACGACMVGKFCCTHIGKRKTMLNKTIYKHLPNDLQEKLKSSIKNDPLPCDQYKVGKHLHMDYGFV